MDPQRKNGPTSAGTSRIHLLQHHCSTAKRPGRSIAATEDAVEDETVDQHLHELPEGSHQFATEHPRDHAEIGGATGTSDSVQREKSKQHGDFGDDFPGETGSSCDEPC